MCHSRMFFNNSCLRAVAPQLSVQSDWRIVPHINHNTQSQGWAELIPAIPLPVSNELISIGVKASHI